MKSFKTFLSEVKRSSDRAKRLANYLAIRQNRRGPSYSGSSSIFPTLAKHAYKVPNLPIDQRWSEQGVEDVPIEKIHSIQQYVYNNGVQNKIDNPGRSVGSEEHPIVYHHPIDDKYYLGDGNHRVSAYRLLGKKTIKATVFRGKKY